MITPPKENPTKFIFFMNGLIFKKSEISSAAALPIVSKFYRILVEMLLRTRKCGVQKQEINDLILLMSDSFPLNP